MISSLNLFILLSCVGAFLALLWCAYCLHRMSKTLSKYRNEIYDKRRPK